MTSLTDLDFIKIYAEEGIKAWSDLRDSRYKAGVVDTYKNILRQIVRIESDKKAKGNEIVA